MRVLVTGAEGQLGRSLAATGREHTVVALPRRELDLCRPGTIRSALEAHRPDVVINTAAYTQVDRAEAEPEAASAVNAEGAGRLADMAARHGARLIHVSTDFVFGGERQTPWHPEDPPSPKSVYGTTKLEGERSVAAAAPGALILRTGWLYSRFGENFVLSMLRRMAAGQDLRVVDDQVGTPTWAHNLAGAIWHAVEAPALGGIHHWSDGGSTSWYEFAVTIRDQALVLGHLAQPVEIEPISTAEYPTAAERPAYSVLDKTATAEALKIQPQPWRQALQAMLAELSHQESPAERAEANG